MELRVCLKIKRALSEGIWELDEKAEITSHFGTAKETKPGATILGIGKVSSVTAKKSLIIDSKEIVVLNDGGEGYEGEHNKVLAIAFSNPFDSRPLEKREKMDQAHRVAANKPEQDNLDSDFLASCQRENLPAKSIDLVSSFLISIRVFSQDRLKEGNARKWVTSPDNFLALTIQNRKKRFAVSCRTTSTLDRLSTIEVKSDWPGYSRFILEDFEQLEEAIIAVQASWEKKNS